VDVLGRRCEQLMKAAEKEVEQLERKAREQAGLPVEPGEDGRPLQPIELPEILVMRAQMRSSQRAKEETERQQMETKALELERQMKDVQTRLKALNESGYDFVSSPREFAQTADTAAVEVDNNQASNPHKDESPVTAGAETVVKEETNDKGAPGPDGDFIVFPEYDGLEEPKEPKKAFTHFCQHMRKEVKASLDPTERKKKVSILFVDVFVAVDIICCSDIAVHFSIYIYSSGCCSCTVARTLRESRRRRKEDMAALGPLGQETVRTRFGYF